MHQQLDQQLFKVPALPVEVSFARCRSQAEDFRVLVLGMDLLAERGWEVQGLCQKAPTRDLRCHQRK